MLKHIPKLLLLLALLTGFVISSAPAFGDSGNGCSFDITTGQCVNTGCPKGCLDWGSKTPCICMRFKWPGGAAPPDEK